MFFETSALLLATATVAFAQSALVNVEASHGGAGVDLTNTSITVPLNTVFTSTALNEVSTLYITGAEDVDTPRITCTPYRYSNGTGMAGLSFTEYSPSYLSTNTVVVGSLVCTASPLPSGTTSASSTTSVSSTPASSSSTTPLSTTSGSTIVSSSTSSSPTSTSISSTSSVSSSSTHTSSTPPRTSTSVFITTVTESSGSTGPGAVTITSTAPFVPNTVTTTTTSRPSSTTSTTPGLNTDSAAVKNLAKKWAVAAGGVGLMAWL